MPRKSLLVLGVIGLLPSVVACGDDEGSVCTDAFVPVRNPSELAALASCTQVAGNIEIQSNTLTSLAGLEGLRVVEGRIWIIANPVLTDIDGLSGLTSVGGESLSIEGNAALTSLSLPSLSTVTGELSISGNERLGSLSLPSLHEIEGGLLLGGNTILQGFAGLEALNSIGGNLRINGNAGLTDVSALSGLSEVSADMLVAENASLQTLSLPGLTSVGAGGPSPTSIGPSSRQLYIADNPALARLDLPELSFVGAGGLRIYNNPALTQCEADVLAAQVAKTCECSGNTGSGTCS